MKGERDAKPMKEPPPEPQQRRPPPSRNRSRPRRRRRRSSRPPTSRRRRRRRFSSRRPSRRRPPPPRRRPLTAGTRRRPRRRSRPKETPPPKPKVDPLAKILEKDKEELTKPSKPSFDRSAIAKLIGQSKTNADPTPTGATPQGLPDQHAERMSPSLAAALDAWLTDAYLNCWTPPPTMPQGDRYIAQVRVDFNPDGTLAATPSCSTRRPTRPGAPTPKARCAPC